MIVEFDSDWSKCAVAPDKPGATEEPDAETRDGISAYITGFISDHPHITTASAVSLTLGVAAAAVWARNRMTGDAQSRDYSPVSVNTKLTNTVGRPDPDAIV